MSNDSPQAGAVNPCDALQIAQNATDQCVQWIGGQQMEARVWFRHDALPNHTWPKKFGEEYWAKRLIALLEGGQSLSRLAHAELLPVVQWFAGEAPVEWAGIRGAPSTHQAVLVVMEELAVRLRTGVYGAHLERRMRQEVEGLCGLDPASAPLSVLATTEGFGAAMQVFHDMPPIDVRTTQLTLEHERYMAERRMGAATPAAPREAEDPPKKNPGEAESRLPPMPWQDAAERMRRLRAQGELWTSQHALAGEFGCSPSTINRAIRETPELQTWAKRLAAPKAQSLNDMVTDGTEQRNELDPADDAAIREFVVRSEPEVKAWFLSLSVADQLDHLSDPDRHPRILGRKP